MSILSTVQCVVSVGSHVIQGHCMILNGLFWMYGQILVIVAIIMLACIAPIALNTAQRTQYPSPTIKNLH
jgi:hypothetical protein